MPKTQRNRSTHHHHTASTLNTALAVHSKTLQSPHCTASAVHKAPSRPTLHRKSGAKKPQARCTPSFTEKITTLVVEIASLTSFYIQQKKYFTFFYLGIKNISTFAAKL